MAVGETVVDLAAGAGLGWMISDEEVLARSMENRYSRDEHLYSPKRIDREGQSLAIVFRDSQISNAIGFDYQRMSSIDAARALVGRLKRIGEQQGDRDLLVVIALDGENAWEFYPGNGEPFLSALFGRIAASDRIQARTFSSILDGEGREGPPPGQIDSIRTGSWIRADLTTWIGHEEKNRAWELLAEARAVLGPPDPATPSGRSLLAAEGSDWFWWFGDEHSSAHDEDFDRTFRLHLQNAYILSNRKAPLALGSPIAHVAAHVYQSKPGHRLF
jgi:alpha-amylase/alpha-mannosidase (GH57 family)